MASYIARARTKKMTGTPARVKARTDQIVNNAGGATFKITPWQQLERFLILGSEGNTYYVSEEKLTVENAKNVEICIKEDGISVVDMAVEVSKAGRAPKNDPALMALALCATTGDPETRGYAMAMLPEVARTATHLFHFAEFANALRGWGRLLREGVANWYDRLDVNKIGYQVVKYGQRDGWSHRDLLRLSHPNPGEDLIRQNLYKYIVKGPGAIEKGSLMPQIVIAAEAAKTANTQQLVRLILENDLPRECIPTERLGDVPVWEALLENMPITAMIRNLGKMTSIGLLGPKTDNTAKVVNMLADQSVLKKGRVHPFTLLMALSQYRQGKSLNLTWSPIEQIENALDEAFYQSFGFIEPSNKRTLYALDVSGSMHTLSFIANSRLSAIQGAMAMAMVSMRTESEENWKLMGFGSPHFGELKHITKDMRLDNAVRLIKGMRFGNTDCSLPMVWAAKQNLNFDNFVIYTDNETWVGDIQPFEALRRYREKTGINSKLTVVGMTATRISIADPKDPGMLDVVGFDTATPQVIADFTSNRF